jgi:hypothetical protein
MCELVHTWRPPKTIRYNCALTGRANEREIQWQISASTDYTREREMKAVGGRAGSDRLRITVVLERDGPTKALSIILRALRVAMWFAVNTSGFNNVRHLRKLIAL